MDAIKSFKKYLVESKKAITEQEIPEFTDFEKEILQIGIDNIGNIEVGTSPYEAGNAIYNTDTLTRHSDGIALLLGADLIRRSEIIELAIKSNQDLTSGDIEDLEDELTLFVGN